MFCYVNVHIATLRQVNCYSIIVITMGALDYYSPELSSI